MTSESSHGALCLCRRGLARHTWHRGAALIGARELQRSFAQQAGLAAQTVR
jgi:hypothetical protein